MGAVAAACLASVTVFAAGSQRITTASLVEEMTDLAGLAEFPNPAYTCKQFSSYDRKIEVADRGLVPANADAGHFLRKEQRAGREEFVMVDTAGPGALVRIWSANPAGTVRIYLDGAEQPVIEAAMPDLWAASSRIAAPHCGRVQQGVESLPADPVRAELQGDQRQGRLLLSCELPHLSGGGRVSRPSSAGIWRLWRRASIGWPPSSRSRARPLWRMGR